MLIYYIPIFPYRMPFCKSFSFLLQEKSQLQKKLQESERRLRLIELTDTTDASVAKRCNMNIQINKHKQWFDFSETTVHTAE